METRYVSRTAKATLDTKRFIVDNYDTRPFGYEI